jgi:hypothetical protein
VFKFDPRANWAFFDFGKEAPIPLSTCFEDSENVVNERFACKRLVGDSSFDKDSRRFEMIYHERYIDQGFWEQLRRERPEQYRYTLSHDHMSDLASHPDPLFIEIGKCSPS